MCSTQFILRIVGFGFCFGIRADGRSRQQNPRFRNERRGTKTRKYEELYEQSYEHFEFYVVRFLNFNRVYTIEKSMGDMLYLPYRTKLYYYH